MSYCGQRWDTEGLHFFVVGNWFGLKLLGFLWEGCAPLKLFGALGLVLI